MAYLDRLGDAALAERPRSRWRARTERPTTFGWGPRFLHSTGQYHKGGPPTGCSCRSPASPTRTSTCPAGRSRFGRLIAAQAAGDAQVLADHGRPVLRLHLTDRAAGLARLLGGAARARP